jgi:hypothetical protein
MCRVSNDASPLHRGGFMVLILAPINVGALSMRNQTQKILKDGQIEITVKYNQAFVRGAALNIKDMLDYLTSNKGKSLIKQIVKAIAELN